MSEERLKKIEDRLLQIERMLGLAPKAEAKPATGRPFDPMDQIASWTPPNVTEAMTRAVPDGLVATIVRDGRRG